LLIARFDPTGRALSATKAGTGTLSMDVTALDVDAAGNVLTAGRFFGQPDFDPGPGVARRNDGGGIGLGDNFYVLKLGRAGFPSATLHPLVLPEPGATSMFLTVTYSADSPINASTVDSRDIRVLGPNNFSQPAALVSKTSNADGSLTATYRVTPPGGTWDAGDNGVYTVALQSSQIASSAGQFVGGMTLGSFRPTLPMFGDVNRDGRVDGSDFALLAANFGKTAGTAAATGTTGVTTPPASTKAQAPAPAPAPVAAPKRPGRRPAAPARPAPSQPGLGKPAAKLPRRRPG
jgi:hypothetical protein